jgi:hypothetical protein
MHFVKPWDVRLPRFLGQSFDPCRVLGVFS